MKILALFIFSISSLSWATDLVRSYLPGETITREWYTLNYNEEHEVANWVSYTLERSQLKNCVKRANGFRPDPLISTGSAAPSDYQDSGFDRGHLLPAGDMKFESEAMRDTFYLSNITPQPARFNRGRWSQLETLVRAWAKKYGKIWVVTGPVLRKGLPWIGQSNSVSVPDEYFKVILRKEKQGYLGIAFLVSTEVPFPNLDAYALEIDKVEDLTKNDFFPFLSPIEEGNAEGSFDPGNWDFTARFEYFPCGA